MIAFAPYSTLRSPIPARLALQNLPTWPFAPIAFLTLRIFGRMDSPLEKDARELRAPLLVMAGDHDPISPLADAQKISSAAPRGTLNRGRIVCTCHDVSEAEIRGETAQGATLPALQAKLKCGTDCGSCLPAVKQLLADQALNARAVA